MSNPADDARDKLLLLTAALFAVRLFRQDPAISASTNPSAATLAKLGEWEQLDREANAKAAAADAAAIMAAVSVVKL